jgi:hypothetical protein
LLGSCDGGIDFGGTETDQVAAMRIGDVEDSFFHAPPCSLWLATDKSE